MDEEIRPVAERLSCVPIPAECKGLIGHQAALAQFAHAYKANKLHHAWLLSGPKGIGKATFAFQCAKHMFAHGGGQEVPADFDSDAIPHTIHQQVAQGAHPQLLHLAKPWDEKTKRFKTQLSVDEIRRTLPFFGMTAGAGGWRIAIVDAADDMNASAANALLKILEEPPKKSLFFVITHAAGRLLPTIRSRCQTLNLAPLSVGEVEQVLDGFSLPLAEDEKHRVANLCEGSVRRAVQLAEGSILQDYTLFETLMHKRAKGDAADWLAAHKIADSLCRKGQEESYALFLDLVSAFVAHQVRQDVDIPLADLAGWAEVWEKMHHSITVANGFNLDKKQVILTLFGLLFQQFS